MMILSRFSSVRSLRRKLSNERLSLNFNTKAAGEEKKILRTITIESNHLAC